MKLVITANGLQKTGLEPVMDLARKYFDEVVANPWGRRGSKEEIKTIWNDADVIVCGAETFDSEMIQAAPKSLKVLSHYGVGVDSIDIPVAKDRGIVVCNTPGANSTSVAEMTMCLILSTARQIPLHDRHTRLGEWKRYPSIELEGKTVGIIGFGGIGQAVAKRAKAFGMTVLAYDPCFNKDVGDKLCVIQVELEYLLKNSDFVSLHVPCVEQTYRMINKDTLSMMKNTAMLINTARGDLIDEDALYHALNNGQIAGAGLDVYSHEPAKGNKLFELENIVFTPHCSANTTEACLKMGLMAIENAHRVLAGLPCAHVL